MAPTILKFFRKKKKTIQKFEKSMSPTNDKVSIYVPDDISFSILSKLPLKSGKRFTCVCKSWTLLFQNSYFMNMFYKNMALKYHSLTNESCLLLNHFESDGKWKLYSLSGERFENKVQLNWPSIFNQNYNHYYCLRKILGYAIDGTLCIDHHSTILLWNPVTKDLNIVPKNKSRFNDKFKTVFVIHGFGYDQIKDDYNIIHYVEYIGDHSFKVAPPGPYWDIYSLRRNSWEKLHVDMRRCCERSKDVWVYLNGVFHWWGETIRETYVVSFNLGNEVPITTFLPLDLHNLGWIARQLDQLNGHVAMISSYATTSTSYHISISILGEIGVKESWTKLFDVGPLSDVEYPIGVCKKGNIFFVNDDYQLSCLDLTTGVIEKIGVKEGSQAVIYDKSFLPIGGINN